MSKTFNVTELKQALDSTDPAAFKDNCARSASFGTVETLIYNGKTTEGIDCYIETQPKTQLSIQLKAAIDKAGLW